MSERSRRTVANLVTIALAAFVLGMVATAPPPGDVRVERLADSLRCPQCDVAIADSQAQIAQDMLALVEERVAAGWSDDQIIEAFVSAYGPDILLDPPFAGTTALLWLLPVAALAIGVLMVAGRRRARRTPKRLEPSARPVREEA